RDADEEPQQKPAARLYAAVIEGRVVVSARLFLHVDDDVFEILMERFRERSDGFFDRVAELPKRHPPPCLHSVWPRQISRGIFRRCVPWSALRWKATHAVHHWRSTVLFAYSWHVQSRVGFEGSTH